MKESARERKPLVKAFYNRRIEEVGGVSGVTLGPNYTNVLCSVSDGLVAVSEPLKDSRYKAFSFGFLASEYTERFNDRDGWRLAVVVCTPNGHKINGNSYMGKDDNVRHFTKLSHYTEVMAKFFMKGEEPVTEWVVTTVSFNWEKRRNHSIQVVEDVLTLSMPMALRKRYTVCATTEPLPKRADLTVKIQQWLGGRTDIPAEVKDQFMRLADAMSVAYLNAWGSCEELMAKPQPEIVAETKPTAPATESKPVIEIPAPVSENAVLTIVNASELSGDPLDLAGAQVRAAKATPGHRKARRPTRDGASVAR